MIPFDEFGAMLDDIAMELHEDLYKGLNGGINLVQELKIHPESIYNDLIILGEYHNESDLGRYIKIYYESFNRLFSHLPYDGLKEKVKNVLIHEFIHHLESMAGERDLAIKDAQDIAIYKKNSEKRL